MRSGASSFRKNARRVGLVFAWVCAGLIAYGAFDSRPVLAQTAAGTAIRNIASVQSERDGARIEGASNETVTIVAERLDIRLATPTASVSGMDGTVRIAFTITNAGTGSEAFLVDVSGGGGGPEAVRILHDDDPLEGGLTPVIAPGGTLALVAVVTAGALSAADRAILIAARAVTGSGDPGTAYDGRGDGGGDAIVGPTGARADLSVPVDPDAPAAVFEKTQAVIAPDGSASPVRGAVVTYRLTARFAAAVRSARIDDPVPGGTRYVPGSLRIDTAVLSDAADGDAGDCDGTRVTVRLGDLPAAATRMIQFQVTIF